MKNVFFNRDVLSVEKKIMDSLGIPSILLMENAGANSAKYIQSKFKDKLAEPVIILAGKGNNAGDGFVIARHLAIAGVKSHVILVYPAGDLKGDAKINYDVIVKTENDLISVEDYSDNIALNGRVIIDAIFGIGFRGEPDAKMKGIINKLNSLEEKTVISVDVPSGLEKYDQQTECIKADRTISMGVKKFHSMFYQGKNCSGEIEVANIGVPESEFNKYNESHIYEIEKSDIKKMIPHRKSDSYKYSNGKLFVLAGAKGYTGAGCLSAEAGLRTGSGAVTIGFPTSLDDIFEKKLTDVVKLPLPETNDVTLSMEGFEKIKEKVKWSNVTLIGPGIARDNDTMELVRKIISECKHNYLIDADGLFALNGYLDIIRDSKSNIILTPHFGEFASLLGIRVEELKADFYNYARDFAGEYGVVLVLKNAPTVITDGKGFYINSTGHENLGTVGTGDVLSGIISSLYSQSGNVLESAIAGSYLHGFCGDILYEQTGDSSTIASDLIPLISKAKYYLSK
ncbi:MAG: NAD(P)H-hydrate dehydratase [Ignavibacteriae bacterium]|nr:NAD(P)H-hydrate dehydratase [Ignavibacteriota bacterium]